MFSLGRPRADAAGLLMMVALPFTGVITVREAIAGFANPNIVLIAAMFVIGEGSARTGIAQGLGDWLVARGGKNETRLVAMLMLIVGALGSVMYFTGVVAIFIPVALNRPKEIDEVLPAAKQAPFAIIVALAASSAFMIPIAPPNAMVATTGNDRFGDFVRVAACRSSS
jgi:di/tricarboxylate transporter